MPNLKAKDIMTKKVVTVSDDTPVTDAAKVFSEKGIGGAPVVDKEGRMVGIVSESDLIMQDVKVHFPNYIAFLDSIIFLGGLRHYEEQVKKAVAAVVRDVMTKEVITVGGDADIEDIATLMIDKHISRLPVIKNEKIIGIITKRDIVKAIGRGM